ncbi:MAG: PEP-CTERM sorting domain-containing protein [Pyrinomonadaceae bacterium]
MRLLLAAALMALFLTATANADPLSFSNTVALQNNGFTRLDLFSNPGTILVGPRISFLVDITGALPDGGTPTLRLTFTEVGQAPQEQTFRVPLFDSVPPPYTLIFSFTLQNLEFQAREATLRVDILGSIPDFVIPSGLHAGESVDSYTYSFRTAQPVPEPATVIFAGLGLAGILAKTRRRYRGGGCSNNQE